MLGKIDLDLEMDTNMPKYKTCQSMMMLTCIKQHLSNIWTSVYKSVKQHWGWVGKSVPYKKSVYFITPWTGYTKEHFG